MKRHRDWIVNWFLLGIQYAEIQSAHGAASLSLGGGWAKGRNRPGTQEGRRVWWDWGTQWALHSAHGWRRILALCGCWMASRSSTDTPLWLWKGLLWKATDLLDTPSAEAVPAVKVNTPAPDWIWKTFWDVSWAFNHQLFQAEVHHTRAVSMTCLFSNWERKHSYLCVGVGFCIE